MGEETIIVIDRELDRAECIARHLRSEGFASFCAQCVLSGISAIKQHAPQTILIAYRLKLLHAHDFLWLRQQVGDLVGIPTIVYGLSKGDIYDAFRKGCDDVLMEPIDLAELSLRIQNALKRRPDRGVVGSFAHIPLLDLLQMIVASRLSGRCDVNATEDRGSLFFQRGQLIRAISEETEGEDAFMLLIRSGRKGGDFVYSSQDCSSVKRNVNKVTDHLLLEIANSLDEGSSNIF